MALNIYNPDTSKVIVHSTGVDFNDRPSIFKPVHLVQYDDRLPVIAVSMFNNGLEYAAPSNASANIRLGKKNRKFVSNPALGCSSDRKILFFEVTQQMVTEYGETRPIVELKIGDTIAGSSPITVIVEKNPVQEGDIESSDEFKSIESFVADAKSSADAAKSSETKAAQSASSASSSKDSAERAAEVATASKNAAAQSQSEALQSANAAEASKNAASGSETRAAKSAEAAATSESEAKTAESNAKDWADWANSYARGEGSKRPNEAIDNSKYYYEQTLKLAQGSGGIIPMGNVTFEELAGIDKQIGYMYNVTDAFTTDDTFAVGPGHYFGPGNNILWTAQEQWDVMAASTVSGIKGNNEDTYQQGEYEITPDKLRLKDDFATAIERTKLAPGDSLSVAFSKLAKYCETIESNEKKTPVFGKYEEFPIPGETGRLYVDDTVDPRLIFTWDAVQEAYVLTGGAGGEGSSVDIPVTLPHDGWTVDGISYSQTITVPQMREGLTPVHFIDPNATDEELYAYSLLINYRANLGSITFYATEMPLIDIHLVLKGVPTQELDYANNNVLVMVTHDGFEQEGGDPDESTPWTKIVPVDGMKEGIGGYWDIVRSSGIITREESAIALNIISVDRMTDAIKISCLKPPTSDFQLLLFETYKDATEGDTLISGLTGLSNRVSMNEQGISGLTGRMTAAESRIKSNSADIGKLSSHQNYITYDTNLYSIDNSMVWTQEKANLVCDFIKDNTNNLDFANMVVNNGVMYVGFSLNVYDSYLAYFGFSYGGQNIIYIAQEDGKDPIIKIFSS